MGEDSQWRNYEFFLREFPLIDKLTDGHGEGWAWFQLIFYCGLKGVIQTPKIPHLVAPLGEVKTRQSIFDIKMAQWRKPFQMKRGQNIIFKPTHLHLKVKIGYSHLKYKYESNFSRESNCVPLALASSCHCNNRYSVWKIFLLNDKTQLNTELRKLFIIIINVKTLMN